MNVDVVVDGDGDGDEAVGDPSARHRGLDRLDHSAQPEPVEGCSTPLGANGAPLVHVAVAVQVNVNDQVNVYDHALGMEARRSPWPRRALVLGLLIGAQASGQEPPPASLPLERPELEGAIAGRVCLDQDRDRACGAGEPAIAGARVVLETGQQAVSDQEGRFHLAAVGARAPDSFLGGRLLPGRHRLRLDDRGLPPGSRVHPASAVVEVPMAGLAVQDFAVEQRSLAVEPLRLTYERLPPSGQLAPPGVRFLLTGEASAGDRVLVRGSAAEVDPRGGWRAWVELAPGTNEVPITATSSSGGVRLLSQRLEVVKRRGGSLVVPHPLEPRATLRLPAGPGELAAAGPGLLGVSAPPGTRLKHPGGELVLGAQGEATVVLWLTAGQNRVPLILESPGYPPRKETVELEAAPRPFAVGLLDLEGSFEPARGLGSLALFGRGGAHLEYRRGPWQLLGELELRDQDWPELLAAGPASLASPRRPDRLRRAVDPEALPIQWADDSIGSTPNFAEGRLKLELQRDGLGRAGFGTHRALLADSEIGRYRREAFGPYLELRTPGGGFWEGGVSAFLAQPVADPSRELALLPAHEELRATGGSLYYLGHFQVARGTELVRLELRDGLTGLPLSERHLERGRDYEIDYAAGRIFLARPLSFAGGTGSLPAEALSAWPEPVLVVDYEHLALAQTARGLWGGEASGKVGPVSVALGGVQERGAAAFTLLRATGRAPIGPLTLSAEVAQSQGAAIGTESFGVSDDGGLTFLRPQLLGASGQALSLRARGPGFSEAGSVDLAFRRRSPGFSDGAHADPVGLRQLAFRAEQRFGSLSFGALAEDRVAADPRAPFSETPIAARTLAASAGVRKAGWGASLDFKDAELLAADEPAGLPRRGGRSSVGLSGQTRLAEPLVLLAGHRQVIARRGEGLGAVDDSFSSAGVDLKLSRQATVGLRGGWGPVLGPQLWGQAEAREGNQLHYGSYSVDVDGPDLGQRRTVQGARTELAEGTAVFVEEIGAHDATSLRVSRAVGFSQELAQGFSLTARYERGARQPLDGAPALKRDAGGLTASLERGWARAFARAELRHERGRGQLSPFVEVKRWQEVLGLGGELSLSANLRASLRASYAQSTNLGASEARLLEGSAGLAWRFQPGMAVLRYSIERELSPRAFFPERALEVLSLMPSVQLGARLSLAAGAHAGWSSAPGERRLVLAGSLRPAVKVVGGLEVAAEAARRSAALDGGELSALRGELGYRVEERVLLALGYSVLGYSGLGLSNGAAESRDRVYLRAEGAY